MILCTLRFPWPYSSSRQDRPTASYGHGGQLSDQSCSPGLSCRRLGVCTASCHAPIDDAKIQQSRYYRGRVAGGGTIGRAERKEEGTHSKEDEWDAALCVTHCQQQQRCAAANSTPHLLWTEPTHPASTSKGHLHMSLPFQVL